MMCMNFEKIHVHFNMAQLLYSNSELLNGCSSSQDHKFIVTPDTLC